MNFKKTEMCGFKYPHARKKQDLYHLFFYENGDKQIKCIHFTIHGNFEPTSQLNLQKFNESE